MGMRPSIILALGIALLGAGGGGTGNSDDPARPVVLAAAQRLDAFYVYPARAHQAADLLRSNSATGAYDGLRDAALAKRVTDDVAGLLHDKHVRVMYSVDVNPPASAS